MCSTELEPQSVIAANNDELPRAVAILIEDQDTQNGDCVVIDDVLGDFCEQTGALFG